MTVTTLDPQTALIVIDLQQIDLQQGVVSRPTLHPIAEVVRQASVPARAFRQRGLPVILVKVADAPSGRTEQARNRGVLPAGRTELIPELDRQPTDYPITKRTAGAFTNTGLAELLEKLGVTQVVIVGVSTSMGVEATARQARQLGLGVTLVTDALTDLNLDTHANSVTRTFPRVGEIGPTQAIIGLLRTAHTDKSA